MSLKDVDRKEIVVGRWVKSFYLMAETPSFGRIVQVHPKAGTLTVLWLDTAEERVHNIVPKTSGDIDLTHRLTLTERSEVDRYVAEKKAELEKDVKLARESLERAENSQAYFTEAVHLVLGGL